MELSLIDINADTEDAALYAHLDKDLFRRNMGGEADAYQEVMKRLLG